MTTFEFTGPAGTVHKLDMPYLISLEAAKQHLSTLRHPAPETDEQRVERKRQEEEKRRKDLQEWRDRKVKREQDRFEEAEKIAEWGGWIYWEDAPIDSSQLCGENNDGFFEDVDDLMESIAEHNADDPENAVEAPAYAWTCKETRFRHRDAEDLLRESFEDEAYEDAWGCVPEAAIAKLNAALEEFYVETDKIIGYEPNYKVALLIRGGEAGDS